MALSKRKVLRSVTVCYDPEHLNVQYVDQVLEDGAVLMETFKRRVINLIDFEPFAQEYPALAQTYGPILSWTILKSQQARALRAAADAAGETL